MISAELYTPKAVFAFEKHLVQKGLYSMESLMRGAGLAAWQHLQQRTPNMKKIIVCCGAGHNAGDAYVLATHAKQAGVEVLIFYWQDPALLPELAKKKAYEAVSMGIKLLPWQTETCFDHADYIIDGLFGIGLNRNITDSLYVSGITAMNKSAVPVFALDVPSGICADSGSVLGVAVRATTTLSFLLRKRGLYTADAVDYCGEISVDSLGVAESILATCEANTALVNTNELMKLLPARERNSHKGMYGHVLVIAGDQGMIGAAIMAAQAAMRAGAGLVTLAVHQTQNINQDLLPAEIIIQRFADLPALESILPKHQVVVIGPGCTNNAATAETLECVLRFNGPVVIDAGALRALVSMSVGDLSQAILTPHPGEAAALLSMNTADVQQKRFEVAEKLAKTTGATVVLKGAGSLITAVDEKTTVCTKGNPGMATAGMGDILTGVIAGLCAQALPNYQAAQLGVDVHAAAGDEVAAKSGQRGMIATDLLPYIQNLVNPV